MDRYANQFTKIAGLMLAVLLAGCGGGPSAAAVTRTSPPPTDAPTPTLVPRSATIKSVSGVVELRSGPQGTFAPAAASQIMLVGDELQTGKDGRATIALDDGTGMVIAADSNFSLTVMEGTHETPVTRFFLNLGQVFTIGHGDLPPGASYEIETPQGVATIRGSMMGVRYALETGSQINCLIGHCSAALGDKLVALTGGKQISVTDGGFSDISDMDALQKLEWSKALLTAEDAGLDVGGGISSTCSCDGNDMKCSDGTIIQSFPTCTQGSACVCSGNDLTCGDQTATNSPVCTAGATNCTCVGPNLICDADQTFYNVPACTGGATCLCAGPDLKCSDGTLYPNDLSCAARTGCSCEQGVEICADGSVFFNTPTCASDLPCTCQGTTFVCTQDGETFSIPNYPLCGGGAGTDGSPTCICTGGTLYCSDGSTSPGDPSCAGAPDIPDLPPIPGVP